MVTPNLATVLGNDNITFYGAGFSYGKYVTLPRSLASNTVTLTHSFAAFCWELET